MYIKNINYSKIGEEQIMLKIIRESFKMTNENVVIATPLIFFSIISSLYLIFSSAGSNIGRLIAVILFVLMLGAFLAGWFYMIAKVVKDSENTDDKLIFEFPSGVGEYFLSGLGMIFKVTVVSLIIIVVTLLIGKKFIGGIGVSYEQFSNAISNVETMKAFVNNLSDEQLIKVNLWNALLFFGMVVNYFILMLYPAVIFFKEKNPFKAFFICLKDTFSHRFFKNIGLFLITFILYFLVSTCTAFAGRNIITHFIMTLINFYYMTFVAILVFNYYYSNFIKVGSNIDTTV